MNNKSKTIWLDSTSKELLSEIEKLGSVYMRFPVTVTVTWNHVRKAWEIELATTIDNHYKTFNKVLQSDFVLTLKEVCKELMDKIHDKKRKKWPC